MEIPSFWGEPDTTLLAAAREIAPIIRAHSDEAERERRLSAPALKAMRDTGLVRMTAPRSLGGLETDPVKGSRVIVQGADWFVAHVEAL